MSCNNSDPETRHAPQYFSDHPTAIDIFNRYRADPTFGAFLQERATKEVRASRARVMSA